MTSATRSYPKRLLQTHSAAELDALMHKYHRVFEKFAKELKGRSLDDHLDLALSWEKHDDCAAWQKRMLGVRRDRKLAQLKAEASRGPLPDRVVAGLKIVKLQAMDVADGVVDVGKELGKALAANPIDLKAGMEKVEKKEKAKQVQREIKTQQGGWVTSAGPGIKKVDKKLLGFDVYVVNKGTTLERGAVLSGKKADGSKVDCFVIPQTGFRVVKEEGDLAAWLAKNANAYLVRSAGEGGAYDKSRSERFQQTEGVYGRAGNSSNADRNDDLTGQQKGLPPLDGDWAGPDITAHGMRIAYERGPFKALVTDNDQFEVISQGTLVLNFIKSAVGLAGGAGGGALASQVHGVEVVKHTEGAKIAKDVVEAAWETKEFIEKTINPKLKKKVSPYVELVFSWQGGQASMPAQPGYVDCTEVLMIGPDRYEGVRVGDLKF
jgi:hypothetical protein